MVRIDMDGVRQRLTATSIRQPVEWKHKRDMPTPFGGRHVTH
jgi:hypothetical protein